ncbi:MAG TPA: Hsp70 family protein [Myxococcales bacterium LLY-WYZ-16_1]|nr:Hsp70 family protein [Myxococcales bacterium LLY-WYZ-16_1]
MSRIIGIDLGTTNSCAAVVMGEDRKVKLIPYRGGEYTIPSIYAVDDKGNELVGHDAKRQWQLNPKNTVYGSKRLMGRQYDPDTMKQIHAYFMYGVHQQPDTTEVLVEVNGVKYALPQVAAKVLQKIRDVAADYLQEPIHRAVVTVPAYFNDRQRQAVKEAGAVINLDVLQVINEPTAAALAFGVGRGLEKETIVIYDLGGGTFDISVIEIRDRVFEVKATGGDIFLGGVDFDNRIIDWVLQEFEAKHPGVDLRRDPIAMQRIKDLAERSKIDLTDRKSCAFNIPFITMTPEGQPLDIDLQLTRDLLEERSQDLVDRTMETCARVVEDAAMQPTDVDHVLLVGGMTRMPAVQRAVTEFFGKPPSRQVNPDEAVAIGAAMYAYSLEDQSDLKVQLLDVIPMAIGIEDAHGRLHRIFERNASVPNLKTLSFTTSFDSQQDLQMRIFQGDETEVARENELLGEFTFSGIRIAPKGQVRVEVAFSLSQDGILTMSAKDPDTHTEMETSVKLGYKKHT